MSVITARPPAPAWFGIYCTTCGAAVPFDELMVAPQDEYGRIVGGCRLHPQAKLMPLWPALLASLLKDVPGKHAVGKPS